MDARTDSPPPPSPVSQPRDKRRESRRAQVQRSEAGGLASAFEPRRARVLGAKPLVSGSDHTESPYQRDNIARTLANDYRSADKGDPGYPPGFQYWKLVLVLGACQCGITRHGGFLCKPWS